ncbi:uncharacterized protein BDZ99DRAFT_483249 [Mytilinidion resinicola]|uniref:Uncharacterized protein n=1 Tax=Mytilinidion resinicola TaxID=574789 RepID=A0A6A6Y075_9PEZI|nr:uncharacterized protein BDZ99DRAFT_483249 [Mytilinidion resinicola]KAF2801948.1 hypothetical protein BDZ99DRAFT_483249 [Mytilinidion resinicola]
MPETAYYEGLLLSAGILIIVWKAWRRTWEGHIRPSGEENPAVILSGPDHQGRARDTEVVEAEVREIKVGNTAFEETRVREMEAGDAEKRNSYEREAAEGY